LDSAACWRSGDRFSFSGHQNWFDFGSPWAKVVPESTTSAIGIAIVANKRIDLLRIEILLSNKKPLGLPTLDALSIPESNRKI
jgi:hypothetical protein